MKNRIKTTTGKTEVLALLFVAILLVLTTKAQSQCVYCDSYCTTTGSFSSAIGTRNHANGNYSFVGGELSQASGRSSFSFGQSNTVLHNYSFALGRFLEVHGSSSFAIGRYLKTLNPESMVIGYGFSETQTLNNNIPKSLMIGFESTKPTLFVGPSIGASYTGKVGIGNVTDPQAKLHIRADDGMFAEDATLMLEATGSGKSNKILMHGSQGYIGTTSERYSLNFFTGEGNNRMIIDGESGNVGIGTTSPTSMLHVVGNAHVTDNLIINNTTTITSGRIGRFANGTASQPAYSFSGNQNTGMFQPAANTLAFSTAGAERVRIASNGDVSIKSAGSSQILIVESVTGNSGILLKSNAQNKGYFWWDNASQFMAVGPGSISNSIIFKESNLGVGCTPSDQYKLEVAGAARLNGSLYITDNNNVYVNGEIHAKKFRATYNPWPDYVFDPDYELPGLCEIEHFVTTNRHLPGLPPAAQVEEEGFELAEMNGLLLKKIEELTLYPRLSGICNAALNTIEFAIQ